MEQNWHHPAVALFPALHREINVLLNKAAYFWPLPLAECLIAVHKIVFLLLITFMKCTVYTETVYVWGTASVSIHMHKWHDMEVYLFVQGAAWRLLTMLWCQVLSGWKLHNRHSKSKAASWKRKDVIGWHKEQDSCVCQRYERFGVSEGFLHFNVISRFKARKRFPF